MAQAVKTVRYAFQTPAGTTTVGTPYVGGTTANLATNTTLGTAAEHDFTDVTVDLPESSKTFRSVVLRTRFRDAAPTTARRWDGVRIGVQIDAVAFDDGTDLTGTGIAATGDHFSGYADRDVTAYFVTNYSGTSHAVGCRVRIETDVADVVNMVNVELIITYEYDDASATQVKTVMIPHEGLTSFLGTTANTDIRGSAGSGQIPNLDTLLPEASKTYKQIYFIIEAHDGGAATTDFTVKYTIDTASERTSNTIEQGLNTSVRFFDIWIVSGGFTTNAVHDFEAWSSLANRFQRFNVTMVVTYTFDASSTTTVINSIIIPIPPYASAVSGTTSTDQDVYEISFNIPEPATVTMVQSALKLYYLHPSGTAGATTVAVSGHDAAGGSQGTTSSQYTTTALVGSGMHCFQHRIDLAHGGTAITLGRGKNTLRVKLFNGNNGVIYTANGYFILNYTSGKSSVGLGSHNQTTEWQLATIYDGAIAGTTARIVATTNQRTPNIPQSNYFINCTGCAYEYMQGTNYNFINAMTEVASGEGAADGWIAEANINSNIDVEFGHQTFYGDTTSKWITYPSGPSTLGVLNVETARIQRFFSSVSAINSSIRRLVTAHAITFDVAGTISGSAGGTVNIALLDASTFVVLKTTTRTGNGTFTIPWFDDTRDVIVIAWESDTLKGASKQNTPTTGFDINLAGSGSSATVGGRILIS